MDAATVGLEVALGESCAEGEACKIETVHTTRARTTKSPSLPEAETDPALGDSPVGAWTTQLELHGSRLGSSGGSFDNSVGGVEGEAHAETVQRRHASIICAVGGMALLAVFGLALIGFLLYGMDAAGANLPATARVRTALGTTRTSCVGPLGTVGRCLPPIGVERQDSSVEGSYPASSQTNKTCTDAGIPTVDKPAVAAPKVVEPQPVAETNLPATARVRSGLAPGKNATAGNNRDWINARAGIFPWPFAAAVAVCVLVVWFQQPPWHQVLVCCIGCVVLPTMPAVFTAFHAAPNAFHGTIGRPWR